MAAWRDNEPQHDAPRGYTNGRDYLITRVHDEGERTRHIDFLLPTGLRQRVTIDVVHDDENMRSALGDALAQGRTGRGRNGSGR